MRHRHLAGLLTVCIVAALTACVVVPQPAPTDVAAGTPNPSPSPTSTPGPAPTRPTLQQLVLTPDGLGTLVPGGPIPDTSDPSTAMVSFDPEACIREDLGIQAGDPLAGGWRADSSYDEAAPPPFGVTSPFAIAERDGRLIRLDVTGTSIPTSGGVRVGSPRGAVLAGHPDAELISESDISALYRVASTAGDLFIEVKVEGAGWEGYWQGSADTVLIMRLEPAGAEPNAVAGSDDVIFGCRYSGP